MSEIHIERPDRSKLDAMGVDSWPIWEKEVSTFPWSYGESETCYILEGKARVTPENGESVEFGPGDLVVFPSGMSCTWEISSPIKKHYRMG
ncbi:MAG: DUF861 domain-containing protein [Candidatus Omnitrophica bacterium]|nr:DUF861 domain-containing protein [Candidatus Omnitrophota bacterium]